MMIRRYFIVTLTLTVLFVCDSLSQQTLDKQHNATSIVSVDFQTKDRQTDSGLEEYMQITNTKLYVDKTLLIREIFCHKNLIIAAPRFFGKSLNLNMLRMFLNIKQIKSDVESIFQGTKVWSHKEFVNRNFCSYPVLYCSFHIVNEVICVNSLMKSFRHILLKLYYEHFYLNQSNKLNKEQKLIFASYIKNNRNLSLQQLADGLRTLAEYMCLHYERKPVVLIDDYDEIIFKNLFDEHYKGKEVEEEQVQITEHIYTFHKDLLCSLIHDTQHVDRVIMVGILSINFCCSKRNGSSLTNIGFTQDDRLSVYYGFTNEEVMGLIFKFGLNRDERIELVQWYSEYSSLSGKVKIYNPLSVAEFIMSRVGDSFWAHTKPFRTLGILPLLDNPKILQSLVQLANKSEVKLKLRKAFTVSDLKILKSTTENWWDENTDKDLFFEIMQQMGYLTFNSHKENVLDNNVKLRVPNEEVRKELISFLYEFFDLKDIKRPDILED